MVSGVQSNNVGKATCPHGLPHGACPICSGGMGGASQKKADFSAKPGEMSWNECAAIGAMMRAAKLQKELNFESCLHSLITLKSKKQLLYHIK